jgi:hypothetical protein
MMFFASFAWENRATQGRERRKRNKKRTLSTSQFLTQTMSRKKRLLEEDFNPKSLPLIYQ